MSETTIRDDLRDAIENGVPPESVLIEPRATNTSENFTFTRELLRDRNIQLPMAFWSCRRHAAVTRLVR